MTPATQVVRLEPLEHPDAWIAAFGVGWDVVIHAGDIMDQVGVWPEPGTVVITLEGCSRRVVDLAEHPFTGHYGFVDGDGDWWPLEAIAETRPHPVVEPTA